MEMQLKISQDQADRLDTIAAQLEISRDELLKRLTEIQSEELLLLIRKPKPDMSLRAPMELNKAGIIACNSLARGIAKLLAVRGVPVMMYGLNISMLQEALKLMRHNLDWMKEKWEITETEKKLILQHITSTTNLDDFKDVSIVFDTYRCDFRQRQKIYHKLTKVIGRETIIAMDDDTCVLSRIAQEIVNPGRVIGFHFTYPASRRKIVEIMRARQTDELTFRKMLSMARFLNKEVVEVLESPGAISTRILIPFINEAIRLWTEGAATAVEIDRTMKLAMNLPMGPLEYADTVGLDFVLDTMESLWREYGLPQFRPQSRLRYLVRMGFLGKKTGSGIHTYDRTKVGEAP